MQTITRFVTNVDPGEMTLYLTWIMIITKTCLFKYIDDFTIKKLMKTFRGKKKSLVVFIFPQNIDCGYLLEPRGEATIYVFEQK